MFVVWVTIQVKPECVDAFIAASQGNHLGTRDESGNRRFDVLRSATDLTHFRLYEVYDSEESFKAHQQTAHYFRWRELVEPMMAQKRIGEKFSSVFPTPWA